MPKPNILFVLADQLRNSSLSCRGDRRAKTPNIDRFAARSADMTNAVSGHPVCGPYRASLFTGKYTTSTGMVINEIRMNPRHRCLAHVLGEAGYETAYIGKWHMYAAELGNHYDSKNSFIPKGPDRLGFDGYFASYNFHHVYYGAPAYYHLDTPDKIYCRKYEPDEQTDMAMEKLAELSHGDKPFALFLSLGSPHDPWTPENVPGKYLEMFQDAEFSLPENYLPENDPHADAWARLREQERRELTEWMRVYYAMTANLDDNFGRLMDAVERLGLDKDTLIVFTSDHGELFGAHGRRAKNIFYEEAVRVPFFLRLPGRIPSGAYTTPFNTVDVMPTLLSLLNLPVPAEAEGRDVSAYLLRRDPSAVLPGCLMMGAGATASFEDGHEWRAWRDERYTYAEYLSDGEQLLFDHREDPLETHNLTDHPDYAAVKRELHDRMYAEMARIGDTFEPSSYYEKNWVENRIIRRTATLRDERRG